MTFRCWASAQHAVLEIHRHGLHVKVVFFLVVVHRVDIPWFVLFTHLLNICSVFDPVVVMKKVAMYICVQVSGRTCFNFTFDISVWDLLWVDFLFTVWGKDCALFFFFFLVGLSGVQHHLLKGLYFPSWITSAFLFKISRCWVSF